jgi:hypothetical protein
MRGLLRSLYIRHAAANPTKNVAAVAAHVVASEMKKGDVSAGRITVLLW